MKYNSIYIKLITKNTGEAPEYASHGVSVTLIFTTVIGDNTEITVKAYNSKMQPMGTATAYPRGNRSTHRICQDVFAALPWTDDIYTYVILRNGVARWVARIRQFTDMSWAEHGKMEEIMPHSKWTHLLTCWEQTEWWNKLCQTGMDSERWAQLTDWMWHYDSCRGDDGRQPRCIFFLTDTALHRDIGTKVLPYFLDGGKRVHAVKLAEVLNREVPMSDLAQWVAIEETVAIDLSDCDTDWWYYGTACLLYGLIAYGTRKAPGFVLHGSAYDLERLVVNCYNFRDIAEEENMISLDGAPFFDYLPTTCSITEEKLKELLCEEDWGRAILKMLKE